MRVIMTRKRTHFVVKGRGMKSDPSLQVLRRDHYIFYNNKIVWYFMSTCFHLKLVSGVAPRLNEGVRFCSSLVQNFVAVISLPCQHHSRALWKFPCQHSPSCTAFMMSSFSESVTAWHLSSIINFDCASLFLFSPVSVHPGKCTSTWPHLKAPKTTPPGPRVERAGGPQPTDTTDFIYVRFIARCCLDWCAMFIHKCS